MQFDQRIQQVRDWISINTKRFPQENQDIRGLITTFEITILRARAALQLCTSKCALCNLLCLRPSRHASSGGHDCKTNHACNFDCGVSERHIDLAPCGLPSGHDGRHLCEAGKHTCGQLCMLSDRTGCEKVCIKGIDHADDHYCSARIHFCGEPCSLRNAAKDPSGTGSYDCPGSCQIPWNQDHIRHSCANSKSCPIECQLCPRLCCNMDHFHGMSTGEVHLCGQAHSCTMLCEAPGICDVKTQPFAINEQFTGRYESFQFTRYAQEGKRLTCVVPIDPGQVSHVGPHTHSTGNPVFHFCDVQCPRCKYYCTLPLGHPQQLHETSHGSMTETQWFIEGPTSSASYQLQEHRYGSGDQGSTVLCSMVCSQQGRHVHVDYCRNTNRAECNSEECQHIDERVHPYPDMSKDWISHKLYWARSGIFILHNHNASPSYCKLSILHTPLPISGAKPGYISQDGHRFDCKDHLKAFVAITCDSSSMRGRDRAPLPNTPISHQLRLTCNNRYGAVVSALYGFWKSRERDGRTSGFVSGTAHTTRSDTYSIITFNSTANIRVTNDNSSTTEQLIESLTSTPPSSGTNFAAALAKVQSVLETNWSADRTPAIIFLSDGECTVSDQVIRTTCEMCIDLGTPLAFFTISFGTPTHSESLRRMARIAHEVYATDNRPERPNAPNPCSYINAIDSIQLARTYLDISRSLQKPRAALIGSSNNRYEVTKLNGSRLKSFHL
ncbi:hypothetical protein B0J17DRAFT_573376 [Rhizoctonia solani]|nr:hypothetical protein B0J17DRAFT_573376 [Rhizoctonia solani]